MECEICNEEEANVHFRPCLHRACQKCVTKMRVANVYKADKGVKCPFCRQIIEQYMDKPAAEASSQSTPKFNYGRGGISSWADGNDYQFPRVTTGSGTDAIKPLPQGSTLKYAIKPLLENTDLVTMAKDKCGALNLEHMLREGYDKRHKVAKRCREVLPPFAAELSTHHCGTYVFHRMVEYAVIHRGDGFFTAILREMCKNGDLLRLAQDTRGCYPSQKMMFFLRTSEELAMVMKIISGSVAQLCVHTQGVYFVERLMETLITKLRTGSPQYRFSAEEAMDALARITTDAMPVMDHLVLHWAGGPMLVESIRWSLPNEHIMKAAMFLADRALKMMLGTFKIPRNPNRVLKGLLSLEVKDIANEVIRLMQGNLVYIAADENKCDGPSLIKACLATRCVDDETRFVMVQELIHTEYAYKVINSWTGISLFTFAIKLLSERNLKQCLRDIKAQFGGQKEQMLVKCLVGERKWLDVEATTLAEAIDAKKMKDPDAEEHADFSDPWEENPSGSSSPCSDWESAVTSSPVSLSAAPSSPPSAPAAPTSVQSKTVSPPSASSIPIRSNGTTSVQAQPIAMPTASSVQAQSTGVQGRPITPTIPKWYAGSSSESNSPNTAQSSTVKSVNPPISPPAPSWTINRDDVTSEYRGGGPAGLICTVCKWKPANVVIMDCYHMCCCLGCAERSRPSGCPFCGKHISHIVAVTPEEPKPPMRGDPFDIFPAYRLDEVRSSLPSFRERPRQYRPPGVFDK